RDIKWVKYEDGTPYIDKGGFFFTATVAGLQDGTPDAPIQGSYMGTFSFDPKTCAIRQVGRILFDESLGSTSYTVGDHAGQIVYDRDHNYWLVSASSFGLFDRSGVLRPVGELVTESPLEGVHTIKGNPIKMASYSNQ